MNSDPQSFQNRVAPWMEACFGAEIAMDRMERGDRLLEEVLELLQAVGYPQERVPALQRYVFSRLAGEPEQEAGGVMVTFAAFCLAHGIDMHGAGETELARVWTKVEEIRAKQVAKPTGSALPAAWTPSEADGAPLSFTYRNYRGELASRRAFPIWTWFGSTEWHTEPQWLMRAFDLDKGEMRDFAMRDIEYGPVTTHHVLAAAQELYGVAALDKVTGRAIERAGYTLPGSAPVQPLARAQGEPVAWECDGCGTISRDPYAYLAEIRAKGALSCCPERKLKPLYAAAPPAPVASHQAPSVINKPACVSPVGDDVIRCAICAEPFVAGEICATDINEGTCHAECLEGSPVVDLETGDPFDGPIGTFPWEPDPATESNMHNLHNAPPPEPAKAEVVDHRKLLEKAVSALDYFADAVFNDNGDMSVTGVSFDPDKHILAYQVRRRILSALATPPTAPAADRSAALERAVALAQMVENAFSPNRVSLEGADGALPGEEA